MKTKLFFLFFVTLLILSCSKDKVILVVLITKDSSALKYIWSIPLAEDTSKFGRQILLSKMMDLFLRVFAGPENIVQKINIETLETEEKEG
ncbi:MAG: hypothetical protein R2784_13545 [Saprospiraceae bacterium]